MTTFPDFDLPPEEDSDDLTNEDILGSRLTGRVGDVVQYLQSLRCLGSVPCQARVILTGHALRRRGKNLYWRVSLCCPQGHPSQVTFQADWLRPPSNEL